MKYNIFTVNTFYRFNKTYIKTQEYYQSLRAVKEKVNEVILENIKEDVINVKNSLILKTLYSKTKI